MAQLNRYSFAGYYFNQPNVKVRQVTKGSPPLRGSNFIAPGRTGEIWTPKKHGGRMLTLEILVIDEPRGTARMIFDQIQQLAATRTQGALVNYLDSGPRTAQAEIVNWTAQDIDNVGLVFVGQLDFYLADPWFYGATVSGSVTVSPSIGIGSSVSSGAIPGARTSYTLTLSGVTSGQPIIVVNDTLSGAADPTSIADSFSTPYSWTKIVAGTSGYIHRVSLWIGTGGVGTSGVITVNLASAQAGGVAVPLTGMSVSAGALAVDVSGSSVGTIPPLPSLSLTPTTAVEIAIYGMGSGGVSDIPGWRPLGALAAAGQNVLVVDGYLGPAASTPLVGTANGYPGNFFGTAGAIIKGGGGSATNLVVTNPGTVLAEKMTLDFLGPIANPMVLNSTTGASVTYTGTVALGKHLIIDTGAYTALNDGNNATGGITHSGTAPFMALAPGVNSLLIYGSTSGSPTLTVSFGAPYE